MYKCRECGQEMYIDDVDYNFKGNKDVYYICKNTKCGAGCKEQWRYGRPFKQIWNIENNDFEKTYVVRL